jgi:hypothetical protein
MIPQMLPLKQTLRSWLLRCSIPVNRDTAQLRRYKNQYIGQKAVVVGSGPSADPEALDQVHCLSFGMNQAFKLFAQTSWRPNFYVLSDLLVAQNYGKEILSTVGFPIFAAHNLKPVLGEHENIIYFWKENENYSSGLPQFSYNCLEKIHGGFTTTYICFQFALYFGIREVGTLGIDASYQYDSKASKGQFYEYEVHEGGSRENHAIANYHDPDKPHLRPKVDEQKLSYMKARESYYKVGARVYNIGFGSPMEIFPKMNIHEFLGNSN